MEQLVEQLVGKVDATAVVSASVTLGNIADALGELNRKRGAASAKDATLKHIEFREVQAELLIGLAMQEGDSLPAAIEKLLANK